MFRILKCPFCSIAIVCFALAVVVGGIPSAHADEADQDRARKAMLRGEVEPLHKALSVIEKNFQGAVIEVELEEEDKFGIGPTLIYEMKLLSPDGKVMKIKIHAKNLEILSVEGNDTSDEKQEH